MALSGGILPADLSHASITALLLSKDLPTPSLLETLRTNAAFHAIYLLHFAPPAASQIPHAAPEPDGSVTLVLRVSGRDQFPGVKTRNEVGAMAWVSQHTRIPVPRVVCFDDTTDNPLAAEFTLLTRAPGVSVDSIYHALTEEQKTALVKQMAGFVVELAGVPWHVPRVAGLVLQADGSVAADGPPLEETFWQAGDIERYWAAQGLRDESIATLNPLDGPCSSWAAYAAACIQCYAHAIATHPLLAAHRDLVPRLRAFAAALSEKVSDLVAALDRVGYVVAHKDLHFGNVMCDPATMRVTAVLDWEFAGVVAAPRWNPVRAFLWNGRESGDEARREKDRLYGVFEERVREMGRGDVLERMCMNESQERMNTVVNYTRAVVEVCPRGEDAMGEKVVGWRRLVEEALEGLGV